ncbi:MAG: ATP-binding cassette domain-containing protein [Syntrophaceae bacterium]|nr:ATP-binding cassette domain-containing protein [Syntrophaceae bacterium]
MKGIGLVFQSLNLIDALSARENVEYVLLLQGIGSKIRRKRSTAILQSMGLEELMDRNIHQMSGGHRQRIAVAWAVVAEPQLILADEPTANLDSENGESLIRQMEQFNRSNRYYVYDRISRHYGRQPGKTHYLVEGWDNREGSGCALGI